MLSRAKSKYVRISPYKLRPIANVIRGLSVDRALSWLKVHSIKKMRPVTKTLMSAYANLKNVDLADGLPMDALFIKEIRVDQGPVVTYFKPGAMGRACLQQKRMSHIEIILDKKAGVKNQAGSKKAVEKKTSGQKTETEQSK